MEKEHLIIIIVALVAVVGIVALVVSAQMNQNMAGNAMMLTDGGSCGLAYFTYDSYSNSETMSWACTDGCGWSRCRSVSGLPIGTGSSYCSTHKCASAYQSK